MESKLFETESGDLAFDKAMAEAPTGQVEVQTDEGSEILNNENVWEEKNTQTPLNEEVNDGKEKAAEEEKLQEVKGEKLPESLVKVLPEAKTLEDVSTHISTLKESLESERTANDKFVELLNSNPLIVPFLSRMKDGLPIQEAIRELVGMEGEDIPDPKKDPNGYRAYEKRMLQAQVNLELQKKEQASNAAKMEAARKQADSDMQVFKKEHNLSDSEEEKFKGWIREMVFGNPETFRLPSDFFHRMWKAYNYDSKMRETESQVKEAEKKGIVAGKNQVIDVMKNKAAHRGDGLPKFQSSGGTPATRKRDDLDDLADSIQSRSKIFN